MDKASAALRVFFEDPFWVGIMERCSGGQMWVCKITFGPEPRDFQIQDFLIKNYYRLQFSPAVADAAGSTHRNPKRILREVRRQMQDTGIGTKSQQALKLQQEQMKAERTSGRRERREAQKERQFELKQQKKKEKHRGR